jgi:hypothetical protein
MNWSKIICIELKKYNNQQLNVICEQLNLQKDTLKVFKDSGSTKLFFEQDNPYVIGSVKKEELRDKFHKPLYKGLYLNSNYSHLTQKEKDRLLNMKPTEFITKKKSTKKVECEKINEVFQLDDILDKIYKFGLSSLTKSEKIFLDEESKKM